MKRTAIIIFSILIVLVIGFVGYGKYSDYKLNKDVKKVINVQNKMDENEVVRDYNVLLYKYKNNSGIYSSLSAYYVSKDKLDKAIDVLYLGLNKN